MDVGTEIEIEAFVAAWMRDNCHVLEEIVLLQADDSTTAYGAAIDAYLATVPGWKPSRTTG